MNKILLFIAITVFIPMVTLNAQNTCLEFDGVDEYVLVPSNSELRPVNNFTIEAWIKPFNISDSQNIVAHDEDGGGNDAYALFITDSVVGFGAHNGTTQFLYSDEKLVENEWNHIAGVYDNSTLILYVNGVSKTLTGSGDIVYSVIDYLNIGRRGGTALPNTSLFNGQINEIRFWNTARTEQEIIDKMYEHLTGAETGLVAFWQFDEGFGINLVDYAGNNDGIITNMEDTDWVVSTLLYEPAILGMYPADNSNDLGSSDDISIIFDKNVISGPGNIFIHKGSDDSLVETIPATSCVITDVLVTIDPAIDLEPLTDYYILVDSTAFMNTDSLYFNGISDKTVWNFTTLDIVSLLSLTPPDNSVNISLSENFVIEFDKSIIAGSGSVNIHKGSDDSIVETIPASSCIISDSLVTIDPTIDLEPLTDYYILVDNTAFLTTDSIYFDGISDQSVWNLTTAFIYDNACLDFDGVDGFVQTTLDAQPSALAETTWEAWIKPDRLYYSTYQALMSTDNGGWDRGIWIAPNSDQLQIGYGTTGWYPGVSLVVDQWYHIAVVYKTDNVLFYLDGVEYSLGQIPIGQDTNLNLMFGANGSDHTLNYEGQIDEVRIWDLVRTEQEIHEDMLNPLTGSETGLVAYYNFNESAGTILGDSAGSYDGTIINLNHESWVGSTCFYPQYRYSSPQNNGIEVSIASNFEITFNQNILPGSGKIEIHKDSDDSIVETFSAVSITITNNIATIDPSSDLEYSTDYYVLIDSSAFMNSDSLFYEGISYKTFWKFTTEDPVNILSLSPPDNSVNNPLSGNYTVEFNRRIFAGTGSITLHKGSDDSLVETIPASSCIISDSLVTIDPVIDLEPLTDYYFLIDPDAFYDVSNYDYAGISDNSSWNFSTAFIYDNACLDFDGANEYILVPSTPDLRPLNNFTIEAWIKPDDISAGQNIVAHDEDGGGNDAYSLSIIDSVVGFGAHNGTSQFLYSDEKLTENTWNHVAAVYDNSAMTLYVNGVPKTLAGSGDILYSITDYLNIGRRGGTYLPNTSFFNGKMDEIRFWNTVRTETEINDNMFKSLTGSETGLVAYYNFNESAGANLGDSAGSNDGTLKNMEHEDWVESTFFYPQLHKTSPQNNGIEVPLSSNLEMTFNQDIIAGVGNIILHKSSDDSIVETFSAGSIIITNSIATIDPTSDLEYSTDYYVLIDSSAFMNSDSLYFDGISDKTFWKISTEDPVYITGLFPFDDSVDIAWDEDLIISFNRKVIAGNGNITLHKGSDDSIVETIPANLCDIIDSIVTIDPVNYLECSSEYYILIDSTAFMRSDSLYFKGISNKTEWNFNSQSAFTDINAGLQGVHESSVAWGDYDNDGDLDILLTGSTGFNRISIIYRNDSGLFTDINAGLQGVHESSVAWGDYDNDGDLDILLTGYNGSFISKIYRNDSGVFVDINAGLQGVSNSSVAWGDYDNDGDLDILLTGSYLVFNKTIHEYYISKIYRNDSGVFTDINASLQGVYKSSVAWGDYDNDGDLDILLTGVYYSGGEHIISKIYRNDSGVFTDINAGLAGVGYSSVAWGDYDNDGDLDILLTGISLISKIYRNDSGVFTDINAGLEGVYNSSVTWGDYDNDGDLDILLTGYSYHEGNSYHNSIIYQNDSGIFTDINAGLEGVLESSVAWGDYDNDGDLDILMTGEYNWGVVSKIYRNNSVVKNTAPSKPSDLATSIENDFLSFSFNSATDNETPEEGLSYNLEINVNGQSVKSGMSDIETGYRKVVERGNLYRLRSYSITNPFSDLPQEERIVKWRVQTIDHSYAGSKYAISPEYTFSSDTDLLLSSKEEMAENDVIKWEYRDPELVDHYEIQLDTDSEFTDPINEECYVGKKDLFSDNKDKTIYVGVALNSLSNFDSLENNTTYYWRMRPIYTGDHSTRYSKVPLSLLYDPSLPSAPSPVNIAVMGDFVTISWNTSKKLAKAELYNVYSSDDPYAVFPDGWTLEIGNYSNTSFIVNSTELKKFYCVTATSASKDKYPTYNKEHSISK